MQAEPNIVPPQEFYDAIVVGSGAAGGWAAKELTTKGFEVLILEAGRNIDPINDFPIPAPDDRPLLTRLAGLWSGQHIQMRCAAFNAKTRRFFVNDREHPYRTPHGQPFNWFRGRQLGGRLHTWGRMALRVSNLDLKGASHDGYGADWPISYEDLAPYYDRVEGFLGVYGSPEAFPTLPGGNYIGTHALTLEEEEFKKIIERKFPNRHVVSARLVQHRPERIPLTLVRAQETGRLTLISDAVVRQITVDPGSGRATGVSFVDRLTKDPREAFGRVVILCASTIETIRILLNSACPHHPRGLGNSSGLLGTSIMDHVMTGLAGTTRMTRSAQNQVEADPYDFGRATGFYVPRFRNVDGQSSNFLRGYGIQGAIGRDPPFWYTLAHGEMLPRLDNRVTLHPHQRDAWGIPIAEIRCNFSANELRMARDQLETMREMARAANLLVRVPPSEGLLSTLAYKIWRPFLLNRSGAFFPGTAVHETGGASMGDDPTKSVLNRYNQCWDADNVFVTDGSCFVSNCSPNVTLTIMALTVRACDYIVSESGPGRW